MVGRSKRPKKSDVIYEWSSPSASNFLSDQLNIWRIRPKWYEIFSCYFFAYYMFHGLFLAFSWSKQCSSFLWDKFPKLWAIHIELKNRIDTELEKKQLSWSCIWFWNCPFPTAHFLCSISYKISLSLFVDFHFESHQFPHAGTPHYGPGLPKM